MFDLIIKNTNIINGRENKKRPATDIGIRDGKIAVVGRITAGGCPVIDAGRLYTAPGFIDMHSHDDLAVTRSTPFLAKTLQGVTTETIGNCGISAAPYSGKSRNYVMNYALPVLGEKESGADWYTWANYLKVLRRSPLTLNLVPLAGHGNLRTMVMAEEPGPASPAQLREMQKILAGLMDEGCHGLSTGLIYPPGIFTPTVELVALARVAAGRRGLYTSHIRGEGKTLLPAVREALRIAEITGVSTEISHLKAAGRKNWFKTDRLLELIDRSRRKGLDVTYDQYPYCAGSTTLTAVLPPWMHEGGLGRLLERLRDPKARRTAAGDIMRGLPGWENHLSSVGPAGIIINQVETPENRRWEGKTIEDLVRETGQPPAEAVFDLLLREKGAVNMIVFSMNEESIRKIIKPEYGFVGTDGIPGRRPHPRLWGTFPRILRKYVREEKILSLSEAIYKFAEGPAQKLGLPDRGRVEAGRVADLVIFDPKTISEGATFNDPVRPPEGIAHVLVNGVPVVGEGAYTGATPGRVL